MSALAGKPSSLPPVWRLPLFAVAVLTLLLGVMAGLARFGWQVPALAGTLAGWHGALMISGVFGTLISLERAVAMGRRWPYLAPAGAAAGSVALILGFAPWAPYLYAAGAAVLLIASLRLWWQQRVLHLAALALGAALWLLGNLRWLVAGQFFDAVLAWQAFLILTIAGERLELSRFMPTPAFARQVFGLISLAACLGVVFDLAAWRGGVVLFALANLALVGWLLRYDILRHTLRQQGLPRYIATCLLSGYLWLAAGMVLMLAGWRDAALHAVLLGFVFSMVFGHAPIVLPAVARIRFPYHPMLYAPLAVLQLGLLGRVWASLVGDAVVLRGAALVNAVALAVFVLTVLALIVASRLQAHKEQPPQ